MYNLKMNMFALRKIFIKFAIEAGQEAIGFTMMYFYNILLLHLRTIFRVERIN